MSKKSENEICNAFVYVKVPQKWRTEGQQPCTSEAIKEIIPKNEEGEGQLDGFLAAVEQVLGHINGEKRSNMEVIALEAAMCKITGSADRVLDLD